MTDDQLKKEPEKSEQRQSSKPNDQGSVSVTGFVRIFDPKTNETIVETRA
jgi:hypothetical protein